MLGTRYAWLIFIAIVLAYWGVVYLLGRLRRKKADGITPVKDTVSNASQEALEDTSFTPITPPLEAEKPPPERDVSQEDTQEIHVSGDIPVAGPGNDLHNQKTERMPLAVPGADPKDHILLTFYERVGDPKNYDLKAIAYELSEPGRRGKVKFPITIGPPMELHVVYDTEPISVHNGWAVPNQLSFLVSPLGQRNVCGQPKTKLETNLVMGACPIPSSFPFRIFAFKTTVLRLTGEKEDIEKILAAGLLTYVKHNDHAVFFPLANASPLNPFDKEPRVFFVAHETISIRSNHMLQAVLEFPRSVALSKEVTVRLEMPGIMAREVM